MQRRSRTPVIVGAVGSTAGALGYLLEAIRRRGDCDLGDKSPDTLALSVVLIVFVGGVLGLVGILISVIVGVRKGWAARLAFGLALSGLSLAFAALIFVVGGDGPATWFQYCGT